MIHPCPDQFHPSHRLVISSGHLIHLIVSSLSPFFDKDGGASFLCLPSCGSLCYRPRVCSPCPPVVSCLAGVVLAPFRRRAVASGRLIISSCFAPFSRYGGRRVGRCLCLLRGCRVPLSSPSRSSCRSAARFASLRCSPRSSTSGAGR